MAENSGDDDAKIITGDSWLMALNNKINKLESDIRITKEITDRNQKEIDTLRRRVHDMGQTLLAIKFKLKIDK